MHLSVGVMSQKPTVGEIRAPSAVETGPSIGVLSSSSLSAGALGKISLKQ